jgi:hypothetical protein
MIMTTSTTPDPALVAAAPILITALTDLKQAVTTILTGDPALALARITPALAILEGQLLLLAPGLLSAEETVVATDATSGFDNIISKLQALVTAPAPTAIPAKAALAEDRLTATRAGE